MATKQETQTPTDAAYIAAAKAKNTIAVPSATVDVIRPKVIRDVVRRGAWVRAYIWIEDSDAFLLT